MKTTVINGVTYEQYPEAQVGLCHGCVASASTEEGDSLCRKLSKASENDCKDAIWKEEFK